MGIHPYGIMANVFPVVIQPLPLYGLIQQMT